MPKEDLWIFVDDRNEEAEAFAEQLQATGLVKIQVMSPTEARLALLQEARNPAGVLMDVDLSSIPGEFGTGPGIAQDIRTKQKAKSAQEFPIVRFSAAEPVARNITGDPSSDDLFEIKILKDDVKSRLQFVALQLIGVREVYDHLLEISKNLDGSDEKIIKLFGVKKDSTFNWIHEGLKARLLTGLLHAPHVAAGVFFRTFLMPDGLLIDQSVLALRLGVDFINSGNAWIKLMSHLDRAKYSGAGASSFERWWSRGVDDWWFDKVDKSGPLAGKTVLDRVELISASTGIKGLKEIKNNTANGDTRYWKYCKLALENSPAQYVPVDPADSVRLISQADLPSWIEPFAASPKFAFQNKNDPRLNSKDLDRLRKRYGV